MSRVQYSVGGIFISSDIDKIYTYGKRFYYYHVKSSDEWVLVKLDRKMRCTLIDTSNDVNELKFKCSILMKGVR